MVQFVSLLSGEIHTKDDLRKKEMNKVPNLYSILGFGEVSIVIFNKYIQIYIHFSKSPIINMYDYSEDNPQNMFLHESLRLYIKEFSCLSF